MVPLYKYSGLRSMDENKDQESRRRNRGGACFGAQGKPFARQVLRLFSLRNAFRSRVYGKLLLGSRTSGMQKRVETAVLSRGVNRQRCRRLDCGVLP